MSRLSEGPSGAVPQSSKASTRILDSLLSIFGYDPLPGTMVSSDGRRGTLWYRALNPWRQAEWARAQAMNVLPTPVGPVIRMF